MPRLPMIALLCLFGAGVWAQGAPLSLGGFQTDPDAPVEVTAETLSIDQADGTARYAGAVLIRQGDMRLSAPLVLVVFDEDGGRIARMEASGGVTLVTGAEAAEATRAEYDIDAGTIVLTGDVLFSQGGNVIASERMVVDLTNGTADLRGRVRTVLQPAGDD